MSEPAVDPDGKRALFSTTPAVPAVGSVTVECSRCGATSVLSLMAALRQAVPSLYLPVLRGRHPHFARCPACRRHSWLRASVRL
ncbi:MAG: hypothetical protein ACYDB7_04180 [Mycobacteriales bacterium]